MKISKILSIGLMAFAQPVMSFAEPLTAEHQKVVSKLITAFKEKNVDLISQNVIYPLKRDKPLPTIQNAQIFKQRFDQVFDSAFRQKIANSSYEDWDTMGSNGIMFDSGELWLDEIGHIKSVNYSSPQEQNLRQKLLAQQKKTIHSSLKTYIEPKLSIKTDNYMIRVDEVKNGYRYASWKTGRTQDTRPDLVINHGTVEYEGTARNHVYRFKNGQYVYEVWRQHLGETDIPAALVVKRNNKVILQQNAELIED